MYEAFWRQLTDPFNQLLFTTSTASDQHTSTALTAFDQQQQILLNSLTNAVEQKQLNRTVLYLTVKR